VKGRQDESRTSNGSTSQEELQLKQQVVKRIEKEAALILEDEVELKNIRRGAEEKIQKLDEKIRTRKSKVEILKDLLDN